MSIPNFAKCHLTGRLSVSHKDLQVGKIYSKVYTGGNEAYARINGKQTFRVIEVSPNLKTVTLHDQFGSGFSKQLTSNEGTYTHPEIAFADYLVYETPDPDDWFIKAVWSTPEEAIKKGLLTSQDFSHRVKISRDPWRRGNYGQTSHSPGPGLSSFFVVRFDVEGRSAAHPYLQSLVMRWDSMAEMRAAMGKYSQQQSEEL